MEADTIFEGVEHLNRAINILRQIVDWTDSPYVSNDYGDSDCFFCGESEYAIDRHAPDCPWIVIKQLLEEIDNGRSSTKES